MKKISLFSLGFGFLILVLSSCSQKCGTCSVAYSFEESGTPVNVAAGEEYCYTGEDDIFNAGYLESVVRQTACQANSGVWSQ